MSDIETRISVLESQLADTRHAARNSRQVIQLLSSEQELLHRELVALRAKMYAGVSVALGVGPLFAWLLELLR
tara:strand:- start:533 stop:751 length:219 start_codon:yes stop_codon:yes gene_type:complete